MAVVRQVLIGVAIVAVALFVWVRYTPAALPYLDRIGLLDLVGVAAPVEVTGGAGGGRGGGPGGGPGGGAVPVIVAPVTEGAVDDTVTSVGDGRAVRSVTVRAEATGRVAAVEAGVASYVEADAVLVRLDDEAERIAVERARLVVEEARAEVERLARLEGSGAVTGVQSREADVALRTAELGLREAEFDLGQRILRAPIAGWIGLFDVEAGDRVAAQDTIALITDRSELLIDFRVPERVIGQIEPGMAVGIAPLADTALEIEGRITALDNVVDRASRTLRAQATIPNPGDRLRAGMAFSVRLGLAGERLPEVDPLAIQWSSEGPYVWVVRDGAAARVPVAIRERNAGSVLVEADLAVGQQIVVQGVQTLREGAAVEVVDAPGASGVQAASRTRIGG